MLLKKFFNDGTKKAVMVLKYFVMILLKRFLHDENKKVTQK